MTFEDSKVPEFLKIFNENAEKIRNFPGCKHLELQQSQDFPNILFTISLWESPRNLDEYRASSLFISTWKQTKKLFSLPAEAWTLEKKWPDVENLTNHLRN